MAKKRGFIKYRSYLFVDKDPIIDAVRTAVSDSQMSYSDVHNASGVAATTIRNWFHGKTKRPQFSTIAAVTRATGKKGIQFSTRGVPYLID